MERFRKTRTCARLSASPPLPSSETPPPPQMNGSSESPGGMPDTAYSDTYRDNARQAQRKVYAGAYTRACVGAVPGSVGGVTPTTLGQAVTPTTPTTQTHIQVDSTNVGILMPTPFN